MLTPTKNETFHKVVVILKHVFLYWLGVGGNGLDIGLVKLKHLINNIVVIFKKCYFTSWVSMLNK